MAAEQGALTIKELTGEKRSIRLAGRALPYRPFTLDGEQRSDLAWPAGSPIASQQVLGATEAPTSVNGWWKDRFLGEEEDAVGDFPAQVDGRPFLTASALAAEVNDIRRQGQIIEVRWLNHVRIGILKRFVQKWHTSADVEFELTFEWQSQGELDDAPMVAPEFDLSSIVAQAQTDAATLREYSTPPFARLAAISAQINDLVTGIEDGVLNMKDTIEGYVDGAMEPLDAARRVTGLLSFVKYESLDLIDYIYSSTGLEFMGTNLTPSEVLFSDRLIVEKNNRDCARAARTARHNSARGEAKAAATVDPDLLTIHLAREDEDLRKVSQQYYATQGLWQYLMRYNGLPSSKLTAGMQILIPQKAG